VHKTAVCLLLASLSLITSAHVVHAEGDAERGAYFAAISDCGSCHTPGGLTPEPDFSRPLAGNFIGFEIPELGIFYPPNLTPDLENGLGAWSDEEIIAAIRSGVRPDGRELAPIMPWRNYATYTDEDVADLVAYLRSLPVDSNPDIGFFGPGETPPAPYLTYVFPPE
jgi:mono/diheme cytochrome c family protein